MDRCTFLSSLPFLIKLSSPSSWPPSPPTTTIRKMTIAYTDHNHSQQDDKNDKRTNNNNKSIHDSTNHHPPATIVLGETDQYNRSFYMSIENIKQQQDDPKKNGTTKGMKHSNKNISDIQAAYFVRSSHKETDKEDRIDKNTNATYDDNDDTAMVSIQIAVYEGNENLTMQMISSNSRYNNESTTTRYDNNNYMFHRNTTPIQTNSSKHRNSYNNTMTSTTSFHSPTPNRIFRSTNDPLRQQLSSPSAVPSFHRSIMYLKVHDDIFALDISQLNHCEVLPEVYQDHHPNGTTLDKNNIMMTDVGYENELDTIRKTRPMIQPPSLVLYFDSSICFRIFSISKVSSYYPSRDDIREQIETLQIIHDKIQYIFQKQHDIIMQQQSLYGSRNSIKSTTSIVKLQESDVISPTSSNDDVSGSSSSRNDSNNSSTPPLGIGQKYSDDINNNSSVTTNASVPHNEAANNDDINSSNNNQQNKTTNQDSTVQECTTKNENEIEHDLIEFATELPEHNCYKRRKLADQKLHDLFNESHMNIMIKSTGICESRSKENRRDIQADDIPTDTANINDDDEYMASIGKTLNRVAKLQGESYLSESIVELIESYYQKHISDNHDQMKYYGNIFYPMTGKRNNSNNNNSSSKRNRGSIGTTAGMIGSSQDRYNNTNERNTTTTTNNTTTNDERLMSDNKEFMNTVQKLILKNKLLQMEKYKVSLMPERG